MASINKVIIVGHLGRDPEMRTFPSGDQVANVSIATTDKWKDKQTGEIKEATEWHRVVFNGRLAEVVGEYLRKGSQVYVEGSLRTRQWQDKDGRDCYSTEIRADEMKMLGQAPGGGGRDRGGYDDDRQDRQRGGGGGRSDDRGGRRDDQYGRGNDRGGRGNDRGGYSSDRGGRGNDRGGRGGNDAQRQRANDDRQYGGVLNDGYGQQRGGGQQGQQQAPQRASSGFDDLDDDIPF